MLNDKRWLLIVVGALGLILFFRSRGFAEGTIAPAEAANWIKEKKDLQLIDVRTPPEYADGHIAGSKLIPLQELEARLAEIDQSKPLLLYCRSGHRSGSAFKILRDKGYAQAKHVEGGINAWKAAGLPITK